MCRVAGQEQQCSKTSWLQEACAGACALCYTQERTMVFPGMREALCHSLSRRRGLLWLGLQRGGQHVPPGFAVEWGTLCHLSLQRVLHGLLLLETQGTREEQVVGLRGWMSVVKAVGHYRLCQQYAAQDTCPVL